MLYMRVLIVVFIAISAIIAIVQYKSSVTFIAQLMGISWGALAGAFLAPFLYSLYWKKTTKAACYTSFIFGTVFMTLNMLNTLKILPLGIFAGNLASPINSGAFAMIAGLIIVPVVSLFTSKPGTDVDKLFEVFDEEVVVKRSTALSKNEDEN